jgi:hypothetical protein
VLRPGGRLAVFGHAFQLPPGVVDAFVAVYRRVVPDSPFNLEPLRHALVACHRMYAMSADGIGEVGGFSDPEQWRFDWEQSHTRDDWSDQMSTHGALTQFSDKLADVLEGVGAAIDAMGAAPRCVTPRWGSRRREALPPKPSNAFARRHRHARRLARGLNGGAVRGWTATGLNGQPRSFARRVGKRKRPALPPRLADCTRRALSQVTDTRSTGVAMTRNLHHDRTQAALRNALIARAVELGIDPDTVRYPSPNSITARRDDGSLLRLDFGSWPAAELSR